MSTGWHFDRDCTLLLNRLSPFNHIWHLIETQIWLNRLNLLSKQSAIPTKMQPGGHILAQDLYQPPDWVAMFRLGYLRYPVSYGVSALYLAVACTPPPSPHRPRVSKVRLQFCEAQVVLVTGAGSLVDLGCEYLETWSQATLFPEEASQYSSSRSEPWTGVDQRASCYYNVAFTQQTTTAWFSHN